MWHESKNPYLKCSKVKLRNQDILLRVKSVGAGAAAKYLLKVLCYTHCGVKLCNPLSQDIGSNATASYDVI